jgi:Leucine-rich repeat (LRR) protein
MSSFRARLWIFTLLGLAWFAVASRSADSETSKSIQEWITQLNDDRFAVREEATQNLIKAGKEAIDTVAKAAAGDQLEATDRGVRILRDLAESKDAATVSAAKAALTKLVVSDHATAAPRARTALFAHLGDVVRRLDQAGVTVTVTSDRVTHAYLDKVKNLADALPLLRELPDLEHVSLSNKLMDDKLMAELKDLPKLNYLNLYQSSIGDEGLKIFKTLPALRSVPMGETKVTDAGLVHLKDLTKLEYVGLRANKVTDAGLVHLENLTNLTGLYLGETKVTDAGLVHLKRMKKLNSLRLDKTTVSDAGLEHLKQLTSLRYLDLDEVKATDAGVKRLRQALPELHVNRGRP